MSWTGRGAALLRAAAAFAGVCLLAVLWVRCATYACFPIGGGEFHWVLHLPKSRRVAGIVGFAAAQVAITAALCVTVVCASVLRLRTALMLCAVPMLASNAVVLSFPWAAAGLLTGVPFLALAAATWAAAVRWPPRLPALLIALPTAVLGADRVADFVHFFPPDVVFPIARGTLPAACLAAVLLVRWPRLAGAAARP